MRPSMRIPNCTRIRDRKSSICTASIIDQMYTRLPQMFGRLPKARLEVMPVEEFREKEASDACLR